RGGEDIHELPVAEDRNIDRELQAPVSASAPLEIADDRNSRYGDTANARRVDSVSKSLTARAARIDDRKALRCREQDCVPRRLGPLDARGLSIERVEIAGGQPIGL